VILDTMAASALMNPHRSGAEAVEYRDLVGARVILLSFVTVTELRCGTLKAGWGELRRRGLEHDLRQFTVVQPDDVLIQECAVLRDPC
jgi:predicted nucleic acid-binding protein